MSAMWVCLLAFAGPLLVQGAGHDWGYYDGHGTAPNDWSGTCKQRRQSPIDIVTREVLFQKDLGHLTLIGYGRATQTGSFIQSNNGHTVALVKSADYRDPIYMEAGGLGARYDFVQMHVHWGSQNEHGSEHKVDGRQYAAEVHLVHKREDLANVSMALLEPSGLAVLGVLVEVGPESDRRTPMPSPATYKGDVATVQAFALSGLIPTIRDNFYRYEGSLTTPPCSEAVIWTVLKDTITITQSQLDALRALYADPAQGSSHQRHMQDNYRPVQKMYGRQVTANFQPSSAAAITTSLLLPAAAAVLALCARR